MIDDDALLRRLKDNLARTADLPIDSRRVENVIRQSKATGYRWRSGIHRAAPVAVGIAIALAIATVIALPLFSRLHGSPPPATSTPSSSPTPNHTPVSRATFVFEANTVCQAWIRATAEIPVPKTSRGVLDPEIKDIPKAVGWFSAYLHTFVVELADLEALGSPPSMPALWAQALAAVKAEIDDWTSLVADLRSENLGAFSTKLTHIATYPGGGDFTAFGAIVCGGGIPPTASPGPNSLIASSTNGGSLVVPTQGYYDYRMSSACLSMYTFYMVDVSETNEAWDFVGNLAARTSGTLVFTPGTWQGHWYLNNEPNTSQFLAHCPTWKMTLTPEPFPSAGR